MRTLAAAAVVAVLSALLGQHIAMTLLAAGVVATWMELREAKKST